MEITKTLKITYPTVTYHGAELFVAVKVTENDIPENVGPLERSYGYLNKLADQKLIEAFTSEYQTVSQHLVNQYGGQYVTSIIPHDLEQQLIQSGRIRTDATGKPK